MLLLSGDQRSMLGLRTLLMPPLVRSERGRELHCSHPRPLSAGQGQGRVETTLVGFTVHKVLWWTGVNI